MSERLFGRLQERLDQLDREGTYKRLRYLDGPSGARVELEGRGEVLLMSSNDYLGLANHPDVVAATHAGLEKFGAGGASVRFICGTLTIHRQLEEAIAAFLHTEAALTYTSCWAANTGLIPVIAQPGDAAISDALNHASIIDGCRMVAKGVARAVYKHSDLDDLAEKLETHKDANNIVVITDGVFSMEGDCAKLGGILDLTHLHNATLVVDDSHGIGVLGKTGRGLIEHCGLLGEVDIITGTLGKALGGAGGGFVAGPKALTETLVQASRPHLFSNSLPGDVAAGGLAAIETLDANPGLVAGLQQKTARFRELLRQNGVEPLDGNSAIVPVILGPTAKAIAAAERLLDEGIFVTGFGFPVVPEGEARLRFQISAAHSDEDLARVAETTGRIIRDSE